MTAHFFSGSRILAVASAMVFLAGCTTVSKDGGFNTVSTTASERLGKDAVLVKTDEDRDAVAKRTHELLSRPLGMDDAVQIVLLNNRGLQASYGELGISEADLVQAGRLPNPGFNFSRTHGGSDLSINRTFTLGLLNVLTLPLAPVRCSPKDSHSCPAPFRARQAQQSGETPSSRSSCAMAATSRSVWQQACTDGHWEARAAVAWWRWPLWVPQAATQHQPCSPMLLPTARPPSRQENFDVTPFHLPSESVGDAGCIVDCVVGADGAEVIASGGRRPPTACCRSVSASQ